MLFAIVFNLTGKLKALKSSAAAGSPEDAAAALDSLLSDLNSMLAKSVSMLGGPDNPAASALRASLLPLSTSAANIKAALMQQSASGSSSGSSAADIAALIDQFASAVGDAGGSVSENMFAASAQVLGVKAAARTLVAAEGVVGSLDGALADLKAQMGSISSAPEAAQQRGDLMRATVDEIVAQLAQLKLTGIASMDEEDEGAAVAAALEKLLAEVQAKGEALAVQVQEGQVKGTAALDEVRIACKSVYKLL